MAKTDTASLSVQGLNEKQPNTFIIKMMGEMNAYLLHAHIDVQNGTGSDPKNAIAPIIINYTDDAELAVQISNPVFANLLCGMLNLTVGTDRMYKVTHCVIPKSMVMQKAPVTIPSET